jgi:methylthioribose-1-phosphate isomerase
LKDGNGIPIEERAEEEVLTLAYEWLAPIKTRARNPAFDITPKKYVTGYITENGVLKAKDLSILKKQATD